MYPTPMKMNFHPQRVCKVSDQLTNLNFCVKTSWLPQGLVSFWSVDFCNDNNQTISVGTKVSRICSPRVKYRRKQGNNIKPSNL